MRFGACAASPRCLADDVSSPLGTGVRPVLTVEEALEKILGYVMSWSRRETAARRPGPGAGGRCCRRLRHPAAGQHGDGRLRRARRRHRGAEPASIAGRACGSSASWRPAICTTARCARHGRPDHDRRAHARAAPTPSCRSRRPMSRRDGSSGRSPSRVASVGDIQAVGTGDNVRHAGEDIRKGTPVLTKGTVLRAGPYRRAGRPRPRNRQRHPPAGRSHPLYRRRAGAAGGASAAGPDP